MSVEDKVVRAHELDEQSLARVNYVASLPKDAHIHISGICGTGTGAVLSLLKDLGFYVTGSDKAFYPPMGTIVKDLADKVYEGYSAENLSKRPDLIVVGNALPVENPEIQYLLEENLPYASMPEVFSALLIGEREFCKTSVVVTGTHGKTTTSAACAWILDYAKRKPGYFVGGVLHNLAKSIRAVSEDIPIDRRVVVLEGDEYDSAFFAKFSKFHSYRPDIAIITSLEFDHADIYHSIEDIEKEFSRFVRRIPKEGLLLVADASERLDALVEQWRPEIAARIARYGECEESEYRLCKRTPWCYQELPEQRMGQSLELELQGHSLRLDTRLSGVHNAYNLLACAAVARELGVGESQLAEAVQLFDGVKRRQEVIAEISGITIIEDFAHHPTAVDTTLKGIRESYSPGRLVAVFDPRSNTSRRNYFQDEYGRAFASADLAVLREVQDAGSYSATEDTISLLDISKVLADISNQGTTAHAFLDIDLLKEFLVNELREGDVVVLMSNGSFEGLPQSLPTALRARHR